MKISILGKNILYNYCNVVFSSVESSIMIFETTQGSIDVEVYNESIPDTMDGIVIIIDSISQLETKLNKVDRDIPIIVVRLGISDNLSITTIEECSKSYNLLDILTIFNNAYINLEEIFLYHLRHHYNIEELSFTKLHLNRDIPYPYKDIPYYTD